MEKHAKLIHWGLIMRLLSTTLLVLGLSACTIRKQPIPTATVSGSNTAHPTVVISGVSAGITDVAPNASNVKQENAVITFTSYESERGLFEPLMDRFHQEHPSITVRFIALPMSSGNNQIEEINFQALAARADTAWIIGRSVDVSAYFRDLQSQISSDPSFETDDFWPGALSACQNARGQVMGIPLTLYFSGILYDEATFTAAGLAAPRPGWTWDDFHKAAIALTRKNSNGTRYGFADPSYAAVVQPLISASLEKTGGEIDGNGLSQDLQWYVDLVQSGVLYPIQGSAGGEAGLHADGRWQAMFQENRSPAMWYGRLIEPVPGLAGNTAETDPATHLAISKFRLAPLPVAADGVLTNTTPLTGECAAISAGSPHPREAWAWIDFLSRHWLVSDIIQASERTKIPARRSVAEREGFWSSLPAGAEPAVRFGLEHAVYPGLYQAEEKAVYAALEKATSGETDLVSALADGKSK